MADSNRAFPADAGRATHERSRVAPSPPTVSVPNAEALLKLASQLEEVDALSEDWGEHNYFVRAACFGDSEWRPGEWPKGKLFNPTYSVDHALMLLPARAELGIYTYWPLTKGQPRNADGSYTITPDTPRGAWVRTYGGDDVYRNCEGAGDTIALAVCVIALRMRAAQAIEAQRAETAKTGSVEDESAVGNADVPKGSPIGSQIG